MFFRIWHKSSGGVLWSTSTMFICFILVSALSRVLFIWSYQHVFSYAKIWLYIWLWNSWFSSVTNKLDIFWNICQSVLIFIVVHSTLQTWEDYAWRNGPAKHYISFIRKPNSVFSISCFVIFFFLKMSYYMKKGKKGFPFYQVISLSINLLFLNSDKYT